MREFGFPIEVEHPQMGKMRMVGSGIDLSRTPPKINMPPPTLGEHTHEILEALGYDKESIGRLKELGVI